jgi:hypothetical protein
VIRRPLKFKFAVIRSISVKVAVARAAGDIENRTAVSRSLREVSIVVMLLIEPVATAFIAAKEIAIRFVLTKVIQTSST